MDKWSLFTSSARTKCWQSFSGGGKIINKLVIWLSNKESACSAEDTGDTGSVPWTGKIPWRREQPPTPVFLPGEFHGQRSLSGYSPEGRKESDMTVQLSIYFYLLSCHCGCHGSCFIWLSPQEQKLYKKKGFIFCAPIVFLIPKILAHIRHAIDKHENVQMNNYY